MSLRFSTSFLSAMAVISGIAVTAPAIAADFVAPPASGRTQPRSEVGTLTCDISPAIGVIIGSQQDVDCVFRPVRGRGPLERYTGTITKLGVDVGFINGGTVAWAVWAPTVRPEGALKGRYVGASANAAIGIGFGTNILTGGSWKTISLQPISVQGQRGLNAAVGVSRLRLNYAG
ncbi:DUF992 domain-containing protein [Brucella haematophila]|jgi:Protein of unknown function (DUF992)|uniref:DUF992 domain-containing protein n=1 Tax=Brucella haematophila TaxID=419474 RepID=A0ABX1DMY8_9HYPH|nr:DUF992 domain-containing protein [Brucella haematophila]KAB2698065.1 DUF992 domain-containing protein [Ochrobactrum sp. Kaboul]NKC03003.1 DUF992 domain-containing protein [Brucella haematophila]TMV01613.1 DUF992 domain-containing protein [Brucella haematophila]